MSPTKKILIGIGVLFTLMVVLALALGGGEDGIEVETAEARVRTITETVTASGQVTSEVEVAISSDVSGEIVFLAVAEGDQVTQGQLLLRIRPDFYAAQSEQARVQVDAARTGVSQAQRDVEQARADAAQSSADRERAERALARQQDLFDRGVISAADLEAARGAAEVARAGERAAQTRISGAQGRIARAQTDVRGAQASARQAGEQLAQTSIYAPMSGTVSQLNVEPGERVVGTATMTGTELMRISRLDAMAIEVDVNENDVVRVEVGDSTRVEVDAYPDEPLVGVVSQIANSARMQNAGTSQAVTNFPVEIRLAAAGDDARQTAAAATRPTGAREAGAAPRAPGVLLRPGMSGTVDIFTRSVPNAVVVPIQAVAARDFNEIRREERRLARARGDASLPADDRDLPEDEDLRRVVFVMVDGKAEMREVETGISDETHIEVRKGLTGGETVITGPFRLLRTELKDGALVRPGKE